MKIENDGEYAFLKEFWTLWRKVDLIYGRVLRRWNLSMTMYFAVDVLWEHAEGLEPGFLAAWLGVQRQMVTLILNDLDDRGFILKEEQKTDRRRKLIFLSESGRRFASEVCGEIRSIEAQALASFSVAEERQILSIFHRYQQAIQSSLFPEEELGSAEKVATDLGRETEV